MKAIEINEFIKKNPVSYKSIKVIFNDGTFKVGFFDFFDDSKKLELENKWRFVENTRSLKFLETKDLNYTTILSGEEIKKIEY